MRIPDPVPWRGAGTVRRGPRREDGGAPRAKALRSFPPAAGGCISLVDGGWPGPSVCLELVVQGDAINAQHVGRAGLVSTALFQHPEDMEALSFFQRARLFGGGAR